MSQGPDITGTEGERLDATVTVDSTFSSQQTQTIKLRVEDFNSGATVHTDSQSVTLQDSTDSQQITLSWPTSSGDKGVYDLFLESDQDTIQRLVEIDAPSTLFDDFADGTLDTTTRWTISKQVITPTESNGRLLLESDQNAGATIVRSQESFTGGTLESEIQLDDESQGNDMEVGFGNVYLHKHQGDNNNWRFEVGSDIINLGSLGTLRLSVRIEWVAGSRATLFINGTQEAEKTTGAPSSPSRVTLKVTKGSATGGTVRGEYYFVDVGP